eukprot:212190-Pleurochrysis_carterae.AAC.1
MKFEAVIGIWSRKISHLITPFVVSNVAIGFGIVQLVGACGEGIYSNEFAGASDEWSARKACNQLRNHCATAR